MQYRSASPADDPLLIHRMSRDYHQVGREEVRSFARVVHDENPLHHREDAARRAGHRTLPAPLTFSVLLAAPMEQTELLANLPGGYDLSQLLHVEQRHVYHRPVHVGDRLWRLSWVDSYRPSGRADLIVIKNQFIRADGQIVQSMWTSLLGRSGGVVDPTIVDAARRVMAVLPDVPETIIPGPREATLHEPSQPLPPGPATARFEDWAVGDLPPDREFSITRGDLVLYSGISGDPNPVHHSEHLAHMAGLKTIVAQAMFTMGLGASHIGTLVGDPASVRQYRARFTSPVFVEADRPATVRLAARVKSLDPDTRRAELSLSALHDGKRVFGKCTALVDLR